MDELKHLRELEDRVTEKEAVVNECKKDLKEATKEFDSAVMVLREAIRETQSAQLELPISLDTQTAQEAQYEVVDEAHRLPEGPKSLNAHHDLPWNDPPPTPTVPTNPPGPEGNEDEEG